MSFKIKSMKKHIVLIATILTAVLSNSCKKDSVPVTTNTITQLEPGPWRISSFTNDNDAITKQFSDYTIDCNVNGVMTIRSSSTSYNGRWSFIDNNHSMCHFYIMGCDKNSILNELESDWEITSRDADNCYFINIGSEHRKTMTLHRV